MPRLPTLRPELLAPAAALAYLAAPGHPLGWLTGLPLGPLGLAALVLLGIVLFAAWPLGWPQAGGGDGALAREPRSASRHPLALVTGLLALLTVLKVATWVVSPVYGLEASYVGRPGSSQPTVERSTEFPRLGATRLDRTLQLDGDNWPLYFFNDNVRFNFYQPDEPDRNVLPFTARWHGFIDVPAPGEYLIWLTAAGRAVLSLEGARLEIDNRGDARTVEQAVSLSGGQRPIDLQYARLEGKPAVLALEWDGDGERSPLAAPTLMARQTSLPSALAAPLVWVSHGLDAAYLAALAALATGLLLGAARRGSRERLVLAAVLALVFGYAALSSLDLHGRLVILDGGADWLTYETYARDILLNGPLMTLGRPIGRGRTYFFQPFYPYALAAFHWLSGEDLYGPVVLQLFGIGVAAVLVYLLGKRLFGRLSGATALAILLGLLGPLQLDWMARRLLSENIYFWLLPAAALALVALGDRPSKRLAVLGGVLLGLCCVTRGPTLLWVPSALAFVWARLRQAERATEAATRVAAERPPRHRAMALTLAVAVACAAVVVLVPVRNYIVARQWSLVANNGMSTMELAHPLTPKVDLRGVDRNPVYRALKLDMSIIQMVEFVRQDPGGYLATLVPLGLYALGLPGMLEEDSPVRWELLGLVLLYGVWLLGAALRRGPPDLGRPDSAIRPSRGARFDWLASPTLLLHSFIALHFAMMMVFLPNVYGFRQVLPMYVFIAIFAGAVLAGGVERLGRLVGAAQQASGDRRQRRGVDQYVPGAGAAAGNEELA